MADYPLVFRLTHEIRCTHLSARVVSMGRSLMVYEEGEWWCHGVDPGGLTEAGANPGHAWAAFKAALGGILNDLASEADSFDSFAEAVRGFMRDRDDSEAERWDAARKLIRMGNDVEAPFDSLQRVDQVIQSSVTVERLNNIVAGEEFVALAEAA